MITVRHLAAGTCTHLDVAALASGDLPAEGWFWVDVSSPTHQEAQILDLIGLHPLIVEDMRDDSHLPKVEVVGEQLILVVHGLPISDNDRSLADSGRTAMQFATHELDVAMADRFLVTYHEDGMPSVQAVADHVDRGGAASLPRPVLLLHRILDTLSDVMVPVVDYFERRMDIVAEDLLTQPTDATRDDLFNLQRDIIQLRRVVVPQAEVLRHLERDGPTIMSAWFDADDLALMRDVYDHLYRIARMLESYQQLIDSAMSSYRAAQDDELNDMLRVLTLVSALLLPISVIASIWGTNFVQLPGSGEPWGFALMLGSFAAIIVVMVVWFRARGWIGGAADRAAEDRRASMRSGFDVSILGTALRVPISGVRGIGRGARRVAGRSPGTGPGRSTDSSTDRRASGDTP